MIETRPVVDGLFAVGPDGPRLIGTRCTSCTTNYFPQAPSCRNPACRDKVVEPLLLPERGTLYSYTVQHYRPPPLFRMDDWSPYALGVVDLGNGVSVMGMLTDVAHDAITIGMPLRLVVEPLHIDDEGRTVLTYKFAPDAPITELAA